ncbi:ATP synthase subunit b, sodium ion specific [Mesoplasma sp. JKS002658]|uniref:F0F1 ATP synthase subunit B n=1 Tax=Mesoplasma whartonense TaxID=2878854 RepID=UPI0020229EDC|nr:MULTISPECIES: F0F1 ATP synthase subunit B [unclassified Mesoplasma]MCL8211727.1 ATP synthase subunit b, sodium ion specific [Mesoplasma sp. JKS002664]MCL8212104.1 ATP synthase subunit b, sodium ion specific [Mesoplasma sp. JKS002662]MCL8212727.1 ATP synthase subunit b, sodium ion specific [Mesoplasma sp. JKS002661]MCL8213659.1 ATP synthase subunit b, sodium ion specific [Mesoplasma sp. JKS002660]MCL8213791.1 ATP synthase subunit b, sodium ion specific [Mesoplasma sp. JKS002658]
MFLLEGTAGVPEVVAQLFPNLPNFIAHVLATIIILVLLTKWVYKPFRNSVDNRRAKINELLDEAVDKQTKANKDRHQAASLLNDAKSQSSLILKNARADADVQRLKILDEATKQATTLQSQAKNSILKERLDAQSEIKQTIIDVAFQAAQEILKEDINSKKNQALIEDFLEQLDKVKGSK